MPNLGANFYPKLVQISSQVGMNPEDLIAVMISESGMDPAAVEKKFKGSGLVQIMPATLKHLGYKGTWESFSKLSGAQQLDWVKKLVEGYKAGNNGDPFISAAQYYTANLWPAALKLPGVKQQDPKAAFLEANPKTVVDRKTGKRWSKKYYDVGIKISPSQERMAYKFNPLFDKDKKGAITYGDMIKQVEINKSSPVYMKAMQAMKNQTGYDPNENMAKPPPSMLAGEKPDQDSYLKKYFGGKGKDSIIYQNDKNKDPIANNLLNKLDSYLNMITASYKKDYKKYLPINYIVVKLASPDYTNTIEFARILCEALDEELLSKSYTHTNGTDIEVECVIPGPKNECFAAVKEVTDIITESFEKATKKIGGINIKTKCIDNQKSTYTQINFKTAQTQHRKFLLKFV